MLSSTPKSNMGCPHQWVPPSMGPLPTRFKYPPPLLIPTPSSFLVCHLEREREREMRMKEESSNSSTRKQMGVSSPCAACKLLRRRCTKDCVFAPYFPADEPHKFANVHKVFGASNVSRLLQDLPVQHRSDAVSSMVYEANARVRDPVYGCVAAISSLQQQIDVLQTQIAMAQAEMVHMRMRQNAHLARLSHGHSPVQSTTTGSRSPASPSSPSLLMELQDAESLLGMDMDQTIVGQLMWS